eukprot:6453935-Amphidinium_carterae.1
MFLERYSCQLFRYLHKVTENMQRFKQHAEKCLLHAFGLLSSTQAGDSVAAIDEATMSALFEELNHYKERGANYISVRKHCVRKNAQASEQKRVHSESQSCARCEPVFSTQELQPHNG